MTPSYVAHFFLTLIFLRALFHKVTACCFLSLLNLLPLYSSSPSSSTLLDILHLVCNDFLSTSPLSDCLSASEQLLKFFIQILKQSAHQLMNSGLHPSLPPFLPPFLPPSFPPSLPPSLLPLHPLKSLAPADVLLPFRW